MSFYWFGGGGSASANALYEASGRWTARRRARPPTGVAVFSADPLVRALFDAEHKIAHWTEFEVGGHFPAMEQPERLAADLRKVFASLR